MSRLQVVLLRHGEAQPASRGLRDFDRPLSDRGVLEARTAARAIAAVLPRPELILASSALRTSQTATFVRDTAFTGVEIVADRGLYCATADALLETLRALEGQFGSVLLVGHNPGISEACTRLAADGRPVALQTAGWRYFARGSFSPSPG